MDTLKVFKQRHPGRDSYKQKDLVLDILGCECQTGNAEVDAKALKDLMHTDQPPQEIRQAASFSIRDARDRFQRKCDIDEVKSKLQCLVKNTGIPSYIQKALAANGMTEEHLQKVYSKDGEEGIHRVFTSLVRGKPRITDEQVIISVVNYHLKEHFVN